MNVTLPDGTVIENVPEDMTQTQLRAVLARNGMMTLPEEAKADPTEGMSYLDVLGTSFGKGMVDVGRGAKQRLVEDKIATPFPVLNAGNMAVTKLARSMFGQPEEVQAQVDEARRLDAPLMERPGSTIGTGIGTAAAAVPLAAIPGAGTLPGAAAIGAIQGALQPTATGESAGMNAAIGGAGGVTGNLAGKLIGRVVSPIRAKISQSTGDLIKGAEKYGIPLSIGAKTQSAPLQTVESVLEHIPFTAGAAQQQRQATATGFNRAVAKTIGEAGEEITPAMLGGARSRIGGEFERLAAGNTVGLGDDFVDALARVEGAQTEFSSPAIKAAVDKGLNLASRGQISGKDYQLVRSSLGKASKDAFASGQSELGGALKTIKGALDKSATASLNPADQAAWQMANQQWANLKAVEKAMMPTSAGAVGGNVSPAQLSMALKAQNPQSMVLNQRGDLGELSRIGQAFVKPQIPNSGTAQRQLAQQLLTGGAFGGALGGGTYLATGDPEAALKAGALGVGGPIAVQKALSSPMLQSYLLNAGGPRLAVSKVVEALAGPLAAGGVLGGRQ